MGEILLSARNLVRTLQGGEIKVTLVKDVSLDIEAGHFTAITGPSGSGKSSLLYLLGLLDQPTSGSIHVTGHETTKLNEDKLAQFRLEKLGFIFQFHFLLPEFTALENVRLPMERLGKIPMKEANEKAAHLLESVGLKDQVHKLPKQMSGGQCQRVAIARSMANDPTLIMADEPTGNLDTKSADIVQQMLRDIAHSSGRAVVAVTHDEAFASVADRRFHIVDGKIQT
ncbi:MAG: ABC transporter ATP-binding protein [Micavibrio aeruginosavorus]|uniref:ABC transporter ATP-binding protein n=1 Tax=Micavibrio aeruginosavorus TaxID=349221 RepID=A0A2W5MVZ9_9BACT|nr:MAG: ABC transporter ATP-binding protein [Micavibrio aeruginosavorus]